MGPKFSDEELVQHLNNVFTENPLDVTMGKLKRPTSDFAKLIIVALLSESGYELNGNVIHLSQELNGTYEHSIVSEHFPAICIMVAARKFFYCLEDATKQDNGMAFGMNDLLTPDSKRLRYFLSHFVNYWLFCNTYYEQFDSEVLHVENKFRSRSDLDNKINEYKKKNADLNKSKATLALKKEKLDAKIRHGNERVDKLTSQVNALEEEKKSVKGNLSDAQKEANAKKEVEQSTNKAALRLKSMAKADETKQELNAIIERLGEDEEAKLIQVQEHKLRRDKLADQEEAWKEVLANVNDLLKLMKKVKDAENVEKTSISDGEQAHEHLEKLENQFMELKRNVEKLKGELAALKAKWDKTKVMKEQDYKEYSDTFNSIQTQMTEDDMVSNELVDRCLYTFIAIIKLIVYLSFSFFRISEVMMAKEETNNLLDIEKEKVDAACKKLQHAYNNFMNVMETDHQNLAKAWENMLRLSKK